MESLKNKYVLLAGATGGIGRELARMLVSSGAHVFLTGRKGGELRALASNLSLPETYWFQADLTVQHEVIALREAVMGSFPQVDLLINLSGMGIIRPVESLEEADFEAVIQTNLVAPFRVIRQFLPVMKERGTGLILHVPGVLGKVPMAGAAAYSASKYGLTGMAQSIREEIKRTRIRMTNVYLGGVDTPFWDGIDLRVQRDKMIRPEEAARAIWFLCQQPEQAVISEMVLQPFNHQAI